MYLLLVGSMSCTSLLLRSARRALGNTGGNVTEAGDLPRGTSFVVCVSGSSISAAVQIPGREGKGRETGRRAATTACAAIHLATSYVNLPPTHLHFLGHFSGGIAA